MKKSVISKEQKVVLSKTYGWIILIGIIILDAFLDIIFAEGKGLESNILKPIADLFGISNPLFLTPIIIIRGVKKRGLLIPNKSAIGFSILLSSPFPSAKIISRKASRIINPINIIHP